MKRLRTQCSDRGITMDSVPNLTIGADTTLQRDIYESHEQRSCEKSSSPRRESSQGLEHILGAPDCSGCEDAVIIPVPTDIKSLIKSFEMVFQLQQRSEEIRHLLEKVDRVLLTSRSTSDLVLRMVAILKEEFDLTAVQILFRDDHPIASKFAWNTPLGVGLIPPDLMDTAELFSEDPFVLDDPSGPLAHSLFGDPALPLSSATVATLSANGHELGLLCLGSSDPGRYWCGMNTELIASLATKVSLGILNAWDHETRLRDALLAREEGLYTEAFFLEYLQKELNRSWRTLTPFSLMALEWSAHAQACGPAGDEVVALVQRNLRSEDIVAESESGKLWVLLPHTSIEHAKAIGERLSNRFREELHERADFYTGITQFSRYAGVASALVRQAEQALAEARCANAPLVVALPLDEVVS